MWVPWHPARHSSSRYNVRQPSRPAQSFGGDHKMVLWVRDIQSTISDDDLLDKLLRELNRCLRPDLHSNLDEFVAEIAKLPPGLRAMAASYKLDLSMTLDDLGWHFGKVLHRRYCDETSCGLWELEATEMA